MNRKNFAPPGAVGPSHSTALIPTLRRRLAEADKTIRALRDAGYRSVGQTVQRDELRKRWKLAALVAGAVALAEPFALLVLRWAH